MPQNRLKPLFMLIIFLVLSLSNSCSSRKRSHKKYILGILNPASVTTLDPASATTNNSILIINLLYGRLLWVDTLGQLHPGLAKKWGADSSATKWYIVVDTNFRFHRSGNRISGADVVNSIERSIKTPSYGQALMIPLLRGAKEFVDGKAPHISGLFFRGDTVFFELLKPSKFFIFRLATTFFSPIENPQEDFKNPFQDRGAGPFKLVKFDQASNEFILEKVNNWPGKTYAPVDSLVIKMYKNPLTMIEDFKNNFLDIALMNIANINTIKNKIKTNTLRFLPSTTIYELFINMKDTLTGDISLRKHINNAINRKEIVKLIGGGTPICTPVLFLPYKDANKCSKVSKENKLDKKVVVRLLYKPDPITTEVSNILKSQLTSANINLILEPEVNTRNFYQQILSHKYQMVLSYYGPFVPHPEPYLRMFLSTSIPVPNIMGYKNVDYDWNFGQYERTGETKYLRKAINILNSQLPVIPIFRIKQPALFKKYVKFAVDGAGLIFF